MSEFKKNKIRVGIVDLNIHNLFSIYHCLNNLNYKVSVINLNEKIKNFDILLLPGVGSFKAAMKLIKKNNFHKKILDYSYKDKFIVAICLGMQLLFEESEEFGKTKGLNLIQGSVKNFPKNKNLIIPHVGWNKIIDCKKDHKHLNNKDFYFIHSLFCKPKDEKIILSNTIYKNIKFCSSILTKNILATQFHPEKSGKWGLKFIKNLKNYI
mgnify:CR=1 FL=1|tara:strand:- start:16989 stop:17618 length:630 start_codon:yes stop_codon:yes gene_type:complete